MIRFLFIVLLLIPGISNAGAIFDAVSMMDRVTEPGWQVEGFLDGSVEGGNVEVYHLEGGLDWTHREDNWSVLLSGSGGFDRAEGSTFDRNQLQHLRFREYLSDDWSLEQFAQHSASQPQRTKIRLLAGAGPRYSPLHSDKALIAIGPLFMFESIRITSDGEIDDGDRENVVRLSTYLKLSLTLTENTTFESINYYQPRTDKWEDYRLSSSSGFSFSVNKYISMNLKGGVSYDARPPVSTDKLNWKTSIGIGFSFEN